MEALCEQNGKLVNKLYCTQNLHFLPLAQKKDKIMRILHVIVALLLFSVIHTSGQQIIRVPVKQTDQLQATAGHDTTVCPLYPVILGGIPTASGGNGGYLYTWSPPTYLDDPTAANPIATPESTTTYMLTVTDTQGCTSVQFITIIVDPCTGIDINILNKHLSIYPNPASQQINISGLDPSLNGRVQIELINPLGQMIRKYTPVSPSPSGAYELSVEGLLPGLYYVRIYAGKIFLVRRIQIQN